MSLINGTGLSDKKTAGCKFDLSRLFVNIIPLPLLYCSSLQRRMLLQKSLQAVFVNLWRLHLYYKGHLQGLSK